jgi:hypothetical protein
MFLFFLVPFLPQHGKIALIDVDGLLLNKAKQMGGAPRGQVVILHRRNDRARSPFTVNPASDVFCASSRVAGGK